MKKRALLLIILMLSLTSHAQIGPYERASISKYTPLTQEEILMPALIMKQRYDNNANKVDALIQYILDLKGQSNDKEFLEKMDKYYNALIKYYDYDLANMDKEIRKAQYLIKEEVNNYNKKLQIKVEKKDASEEANTYYEKSLEETNKNNNQLALQYINKALELNPNNKGLYNLTRGYILLFGLGDYSNALHDFNIVISMYPQYVDMYYNRAMCYEATGKYVEAEKDYSIYIGYNPTSLDAHYRKGIVTSELGNRKEAIKDYDFIIRYEGKEKLEFKDLATVYNNKAYCLIELGEYDSVLPLVNKALELDNKLSYIWDTRGELYYHKGLYQECIKDMDKAISIGGFTGESANSYYYRGLANINLRRNTEACLDLYRARRLGHKEARSAELKYCDE